MDNQDKEEFQKIYTNERWVAFDDHIDKLNELIEKKRISRSFFNDKVSCSESMLSYIFSRDKEIRVKDLRIMFDAMGYELKFICRKKPSFLYVENEKEPIADYGNNY